MKTRIASFIFVVLAAASLSAAPIWYAAGYPSWNSAIAEVVEYAGDKTLAVPTGYAPAPYLLIWRSDRHESMAAPKPKLTNAGSPASQSSSASFDANFAYSTHNNFNDAWLTFSNLSGVNLPHIVTVETAPYTFVVFSLKPCGADPAMNRQCP